MKKRHPADVDSDDDDEPLKKKKKAKKKRHGCHDASKPASARLSALKPRVWSEKELAPFTRVLWTGHAADAAARAQRDRMGVTVPDVRRSVCRFWREGRCLRGEACSFAHGPPDTRSCPAPLDSLAEPALPRCIGRSMLHAGHREPSPIQAQAWPAALAGHDLICRAPTGSGKTLAYLLPAMAHALVVKPPLLAGQGPAVLVLVPTRELAQQVRARARARARS